MCNEAYFFPCPFFVFCICVYVVSLNVLESLGFLLRPIDGCVEPGVFSALLVYIAFVYAVNMFRSEEVISRAVYINVVSCFVVCFYYVLGG